MCLCANHPLELMFPHILSKLYKCNEEEVLIDFVMD